MGQWVMRKKVTGAEFTELAEDAIMAACFEDFRGFKHGAIQHAIKMLDALQGLPLPDGLVEAVKTGLYNYELEVMCPDGDTVGAFTDFKGAWDTLVATFARILADEYAYMEEG